MYRIRSSLRRQSFAVSTMYRTNYEATKLAVRRALNNEPSIDELIANRHKIKHDMPARRPPVRSGSRSFPRSSRNPPPQRPPYQV